MASVTGVSFKDCCRFEEGIALKILSVIGTRPQLVKLQPIVSAFNKFEIEHKYIDTGQHYDAKLASEFSESLRLPKPLINLEIGSGSHGYQTAKMLEALEKQFTSLKPEFVIVYGDTNSTLAATLAARKLNIRVAHIEAGLRSSNVSMPEEQNRVAVDHLSNLLFAPTSNALANLRQENLEQCSVLVGDVMYDVIRQKIESGQFIKIQKTEPYLVCTIHRVENTDSQVRLENILRELSKLSFEVHLYAHPRLVKYLEKYELDIPSNVILREPINHDELLRSVFNSLGVITDSGGLQKEAFLLEKPCITLRGETEWPETFEGNYNVLWDGSKTLDELLKREIREVQTQPFGNGDAASKIVENLLKYH